MFRDGSNASETCALSVPREDGRSVPVPRLGPSEGPSARPGLTQGSLPGSDEGPPTHPPALTASFDGRRSRRGGRRVRCSSPPHGRRRKAPTDATPARAPRVAERSTSVAEATHAAETPHGVEAGRDSRFRRARAPLPRPSVSRDDRTTPRPTTAGFGFPTTTSSAFELPFGVLFTFPSPYLFAIGVPLVLSLG